MSPSLLSTESKAAGCPLWELLLGPIWDHTENLAYLPYALWFFFLHGVPQAEGPFATT